MIFFDIDGTLVDHKGAERAGALAFQQDHADVFPEPADVFAVRWHAVAEKHVRRYLAGAISFQDQRRARLQELFAQHTVLSDAKADDLFAGYLKKYEEHWSLYSDVMPCLAELGHQRLGIISNGDSRQQRAKLCKLGIAERFSVVLISGDIGHAKPDALIFHAACKAAGEAPEKCVYVGDDFNTDAIGSRRVGMTGVWLNRGDSGRPDETPTVKTLLDLGMRIKPHHTVQPSAARGAASGG